MIPGVRRVPILRYSLVAMLVVVLFGSAFYLYLHYTRAQKVNDTVLGLITARENTALIDSCIIELYSADNSSRLYALSGNKRYLEDFNVQLSNVYNIIDTITTRNKNAVSAAKADELGDLVAEKAAKTEGYIEMMALTDSLMKSARKVSIADDKANANIKQRPSYKRIRTRVRIDTIRQPLAAKAAEPQMQPAKKGFLKKLFGSKKTGEAAASLDERHKEQLVLRRTVDSTVMLVTPAAPRIANNSDASYQKLYEANMRLRDNEREMLDVNNKLITQIIGSLRKYKVAEQNFIINSRKGLHGNLTNALAEVRRLSGVMFLLLTGAVVVMLYNLWKIFRNEGELVTYTEKAEIYAQSKSRFMANMSHEIRTPLNSIVGFAEQLNQSQLTETQSEQVYAIRSSSKMLLDVVNEILDFSKYETGKMTFDDAPFSPYVAIDEITSSMRVQANVKGITLKRSIDFKKNQYFKGDFHRLKQVIMNLTGNAIKFTAKGSVTLSAYIVKSTKPGTCVLNVQIKDTGVGIDKDNMPYIFDEFSQVKSAQKVTKTPGTGLGLAICKKIIELQGGTIKVVSRVGKGSIFSFKLPMVECTPEACPADEVTDPVEQHDLVMGKHVLIAEDNKLNVLLVSTILKKWNVTYDVANDGRKALQLFEDNHYDLVLTDIEMPEMGGIELSQLIRSNGDEAKAEVPILALTANVLKEDRDKYLSVGMTGVVLKPFSEQNLIDNMAGALGRRNLLLINS